MKKFLISLCLSAICFSQPHIIEDLCTLKIKTPILQNRKTCKLKLNNFLEVFLISDPTINQSAAAMSVEAGSWHDDEKYPGIAHFTEHMLFQGTKVYPDRKDFFRFISDRKGLTNAYTSLDRTVYMFSINNNSFNQAIEKFSYFFTCPLFDKEAISSELYAVDQEHNKNIESDSRRLMQVWKDTSNPNHPNHTFGTGNLETLSKIPRQSLIKWHSSYYIANNMHLVIYSNKSIEEMINIVDKLFSSIPCKGEKTNLVISEDLASNQRGHFFFIKPIKDIYKLSLQWTLPKKFIQDNTKSAEIITYALSASHKNSLLEVLKKKNLISDLKVETEKMKYNAFLNIEIDLTEKGLSNYLEVINKCFEAINSLKGQSFIHLFEEMQTMNKINYEYQSQENPFQITSSIASGLIDEDISLYPQNTVLAASYNLNNIKELLNTLTPSNCQYYVMADPLKTNVLPSKKEKWAEVEYADIKINNKTIQQLTPTNNEIQIAPNNLFIPKNFQILPTDNNVPTKVIHNKFGEFYYLGNLFQTPETSYRIHIKSPFFEDSSNLIYLKIFKKAFEDKFSTLFLQSQFAGIYPSFDIESEHITLTVNGYSEKSSFLLSEIIKNLKSYIPTEQEFANAYIFIQKSLNNIQYLSPLNQAIIEFNSIIYNAPDSSKSIEILQSINYDNFTKKISSLFDKIYFQAMLQGNLTIKNCEEIYIDLQNLSHNHYEYIPTKSPSLPPGPFLIKKNTDALGSSLILIIDENPFSIKQRTFQQILSTGLDEPFFTEMRSKQKTAYIASTQDLATKQSLFQIFVEQSASHSASDLLNRFENFLDDFIQNIYKVIDEKRFQNIKQSLIETLKTPPKNLVESSYLYDMLAFEYKDFNYIEKRIEALKAFSYEEFIEMAKKTFSKENKKKLAILFEGKIINPFEYKEISADKLTKFQH